MLVIRPMPCLLLFSLCSMVELKQCFDELKSKLNRVITCPSIFGRIKLSQMFDVLGKLQDSLITTEIWIDFYS